MRREAVLVMQVEVELSQRRACGLMELYRATCRYRRRRSEDQRLRVRLRELAEAQAPVRLPASAGSAGAGRVAGESQTHLPAVCRGEAVAAAQAWTEGAARCASRCRQAVAANQVWSVDFMDGCAQLGTEVSYLEHRG
jgi:hypothetical protein